MQITKEALLKHKAMLEAQQTQFIAQKDQVVGQLNAISGAIQSCEMLLAMADAPEPAKPGPVAVPDDQPAPPV
jgi:hypothetical protein